MNALHYLTPIRTKDRPPTQSDGDVYGWHYFREYERVSWHIVAEEPKIWTHWLPLDALPKPGETEC